MKKALLFFVMFLLIGLGCGDGPEDVAKQILEAMIDGNHSEALQYVDQAEYSINSFDVNIWKDFANVDFQSSRWSMIDYRIEYSREPESEEDATTVFVAFIYEKDGSVREIEWNFDFKQSAEGKWLLVGGRP